MSKGKQPVSPALLTEATALLHTLKRFADEGEVTMLIDTLQDPETTDLLQRLDDRRHDEQR